MLMVFLGHVKVAGMSLSRSAELPAELCSDVAASGPAPVLLWLVCMEL